MLNVTYYFILRELHRKVEIVYEVHLGIRHWNRISWMGSIG